MAVTPSKTDEAFLREVDEEVRRDQLVDIWRNYGRLIVGVVIAGLVAFAAILGWRSYSHGQQESQALKLQTAYDSLGAGNAAGAKAPLDDLAKNGGPGFGALARMTQANTMLAAGDAKGAAAKYGEVAADSAVAQPVRDLALIRQTFTDYDNLAPQVIVDRLRPLTGKDSPWLGSAGEMTAMAYLRLNKPSQAREMFKTIAGAEQVPDSIRQRAVQAADAVDAGANDQKGK